uniref:Resolvase HTH domain-containing protein n=1 Tax=Esox lucius TaxID=8010 RepID=A0A6Q2Y6G7_ESOLU
MPCTYKWKTDRASTLLVELDRAVKVVQQGKSIRQVAREMKICRMTLQRFMEKKKIATMTGYKRTELANQVFKEYMETELSDHIKALAAMFHGIRAMKCCELAFEYKAGPDWFTAFKAHHHLSKPHS